MNSELFQKNLDYFQEKYPFYVSWLKNLHNTASTPIYAQGETEGEGGTIINLDIGNRNLYEDKDAFTYAQDQIAAFERKPDRVYVGMGALSLHTLRSNNALAYIKNEGEHRFKGKRIKSNFENELMVVYGLGLGHHLKPLIEKFDVRTLFISETYIEFLYYACHSIDWQEIDDMLSAKGGRLHLICNHYERVEHFLIARLRDHGIGQVDGMITFTHYPSANLAMLKNAVLSNIQYIASNLGFFEDETVMLVHSLQNFQNTKPAYFWYQKQRYEKETPVFVIGSGPSIDQSIHLLKEINQKAVIISCGTAIRVLLKNGIKPDFHILVENTIDQEMVTRKVSEEFDLSDITVVASASVYFKALEYFGRKIIFFRDHICTEKLFAEHCAAVNNAGPLVSNAGLRFAVGMGFANIYMLGIDLGTRDKEQHHSKDSSYYNIPGMDKAKSFNEIAEGTQGKVSNYRPANFGGFVISDGAYDITVLFKLGLLQAYEQINFYNCSDGVRIDGTIPILPEIALRSMKPIKYRQDSSDKPAVAECFQSFDYIENPMEAYGLRFGNMRRRMKRYVEKMIETIDQFDDYFALHGYCYQELMEESGDNELDALRRMLRGTVFIELLGFTYFYRRVEKQDFDDFFPWLKQLLIFELHEMLRVTLFVLDKCDDGSVGDLIANAYDKKGFLFPHIQLAPLKLEGTLHPQQKGNE